MLSTTWLTAVALSVSLAHLSGCASPGATGQSAAYTEGFNDGCQSGKAAQGSMFDFYKKNATRFDTDKQYAQGWSDGFVKCEYVQQQTNAMGGK